MLQLSQITVFPAYINESENACFRIFNLDGKDTVVMLPGLFEPFS